MARRIIWSHKAQNDKKTIYTYWNYRNNSKQYSKKLNTLFNEAAEILALYPEIGRNTDQEGIQMKVVENFLLIYECTESELQILSIFDSRQNPQKLSKILKDSS